MAGFFGGAGGVVFLAAGLSVFGRPFAGWAGGWDRGAEAAGCGVGFSAGGDVRLCGAAPGTFFAGEEGASLVSTDRLKVHGKPKTRRETRFAGPFCS